MPENLGGGGFFLTHTVDDTTPYPNSEVTAGYMKHYEHQSITRSSIWPKMHYKTSGC